jgi:hypothetical protein
MSEWIPFPAYYDDVPVDISFVFHSEAPAGKHGFMKVAGDHFEFEDGTPARFWGTNFNSGGNFPPHEYSEKAARRLAKIGVNIVRFHQLDSEWATPNIFQFEKGPVQRDSLTLDPRSMNRFDYLISCLKKEGVYCYLDMITYRKFKSGDGIEKAHLLGDAARPYSIFDPRLIELQKKYAFDIWTHINPYTGLAYKDDPVFVMCEVMNEGDLFHKDRPIELEPYASYFRDLFRQWLEVNNKEVDAEHIDINGDDPVLINFKIEVQQKYYHELIKTMRDAGVRIPITGTNWSINAANRKAQLSTGFDDGHVYFYNWSWGEKSKKFENRALSEIEDCGFFDLTFCRSLDRPFFVSEWDVPWPNEHRAESPILFAAVGGLQGWSGFAIHTYTYGTRTNIEMLGKEVSSSSIGGVPYREGIFNTWNDPAKFGLFYHSALITRRGDVKQSKAQTAVLLDKLTGSPGDFPGLYLASETGRAGITFDKAKASNTRPPDPKNGEVRSDTKELYRSWEKKYGYIDTPFTKCVYGYLAKQKTIALTNLSVTSITDFAVIALSSLSDKPINETDNILLTAVGRVENTGQKFNADHNEQLDYGRPPIIIEKIEAEIELEIACEKMKVWSVNAEGFYTGCVPSVYKDGVLYFKLGEVFPSMYYLIRTE